eukprot:tig00021073_g18061.t1
MSISKRALLSSARPRPAPASFSIPLQDITEKRRRIEAEAVNETRTRFLAYTIHELRTPLNGLLGMTELLEESGLDAEQRDLLHSLRTAGEQMLIIVNDLLDLHKMEAGKLVLEGVPFCLRSAIEEVVEARPAPPPRPAPEDTGGTALQAAGVGARAVAPSAFAKGVEVASFVPPGAPEVLVGDPFRLKQILTNFAQNAFTHEGRVVVSARVVRREGRRATLRLEAADTGHGIPPRFGGTGMGLALAKRLAEAMGGTVGAHSELGKGSVFYAELTLEEAPAEGADAAAAASASASLEPPEGPSADPEAAERSAGSDREGGSGSPRLFREGRASPCGPAPAPLPGPLPRLYIHVADPEVAGILRAYAESLGGPAVVLQDPAGADAAADVHGEPRPHPHPGAVCCVRLQEPVPASSPLAARARRAARACGPLTLRKPVRLRRLAAVLAAAVHRLRSQASRFNFSGSCPAACSLRCSGAAGAVARGEPAPAASPEPSAAEAAAAAPPSTSPPPEPQPQPQPQPLPSPPAPSPMDPARACAASPAPPAPPPGAAAPVPEERGAGEAAPQPTAPSPVGTAGDAGAQAAAEPCRCPERRRKRPRRPLRLQRRRRGLRGLRGPAAKSPPRPGRPDGRPRPRSSRGAGAAGGRPGGTGERPDSAGAAGGRPGCACEQAGASRASGPPRPPPAAPGAPPDVLVVDDVDLNRKVVASLLGKAGVASQAAAVEAVEGRAAAGLAPFPLILMDVEVGPASLSHRPAPPRPSEPAQMPEAAGRTGGPPSRIVALTANAMAENVGRCAEAGMDACLVKPVRKEQLVRALEEARTAASARRED